MSRLGAGRGTFAGRVVAVLVGVGLAAACGEGQEEARGDVAPPPTPVIGAGDALPVVRTVYQTPRDTLDNIDSPTVWHGPDGQNWLIVTAKEGNVLVVSDAATGGLVRRVGAGGSGPGEFQRPNGVAVADDLLWVVERDNARVQLFRLPAFEPLATYGEGELRMPYGIAVVRDGDGVYTTYITDNYEEAEDVIPADSLLGERVRAYRVSVNEVSVSSALTNTFGETSGEGVLRVVESLAADPTTGLLLIAEELEGASLIKAYDLDGRFTGRTIDSVHFPHQAEGVVLYGCADGDGYWIATDQGTEVNTFHVFGRASLAHLGSFRGEGVLNTDGIALSQAGFGTFSAGAFFAVHDDGNVAALRWSDIAAALGLRSDCVSGG